MGKATETLTNFFDDLNKQFGTQTTIIPKARLSNDKMLRKLGYMDAIEDLQNLVISKLQFATSEKVGEQEYYELRIAAGEIELASLHLINIRYMKYGETIEE